MAPVELTDDYIDYLVRKVVKGKRVRKKFPSNGKINIDRKLPYIVLHRNPVEQTDMSFLKLLLVEASYAIAPSDEDNYRQFLKLIRRIAAALSIEYGAFLIIEMALWESGHNQFRLTVPPLAADSTIQSLREGLGKIKRLNKRVNVKVEQHPLPRPEGLEPIMTAEESREISVLTILLEVPPIYQDIQTGALYPVYFRFLRQQLSGALKRGVFDFLRVQTHADVASFQMLGRRHMDAAVWHIDKKLTKIEQSFDFLLLVSPINSEEAWIEFRKHHYDKIPEFHYRLLPVDPELLKKELYNLNMHKIDDPLISYLFRDKREELDKQMSMLRERSTKDFMYNGIRLYKGVDEDLHQLAKDLLIQIREVSDEVPSPSRGNTIINARKFAQRAQEEFDLFRQQLSSFNSKIFIRKDLTGLMVSKGDLLVPANLQILPERLEALIQHEVGTHVLTFNNGKAQPLQQLAYGLADYDELQEGLAVLSEYLTGGLNEARLRLLAGRVIAAALLIRGGDFIECFRELTKTYHFAPKVAFDITTRIYQAGGFIKDVIYLRGLIRLLTHLEKGGELETLFVGKIAEKHIPSIKELQARGILKSIPIKPSYLKTEIAQRRLMRVRQGILLTDLLEKEVV